VRREPEASLVQVTEAGEKGEGNISFHYSNKSTEANLAIDLGNTDLYMEMSGEPPKLANGEPAVVEEKRPPPKSKAPRPQPQEQEQAQEEPAQEEQEPPRTAKHSKPQAKPEAKSEAKKEQEPRQELQLPEEEQGNSEDVTSKVLAGIRKAQELFYQKRYPEAMQAVKSSLDARPTAEGYALAGSIHYMMGQGGMARRQWMEALRLNPDMPSVVNMLEKTRTPGGRGSPSPRPIPPRQAQRSAPAPLPEAERPPFPEVYYEPAYNKDFGPGSSASPSAPPAVAPVPAPEAPVSEEANPAEPEAAPVAPAAPPSAPVPAPAAATPAAAPTTAPAKAAPAKAVTPAAPEAHDEPAKPAKTKLPTAKPAKEGKAK
jgi:hypothetical protein